jgi:FdhD protein
MSRTRHRRGVLRVQLGAESAGARRVLDSLAAEEPLEIRLGTVGARHTPLTVTMRTPGDDIDLAIGFLYTEGVIRDARDVQTAALCAGTHNATDTATETSTAGNDLNDAQSSDRTNTYNVVDVSLRDGVPAPLVDTTRTFLTTSACGVCGKASIDAVRTRSRFNLDGDHMRVAANTLIALPDRLRSRQRGFAATGGLHAAGLFTNDGTLVCVREDIGRHNAVDKVIGWAVREQRLPLREHILLVSGRASFELCQKAWMAGIPMLAAVSAPSTLAVELAEEAGLTLIGFLRGDTFNVYAGAPRVHVPDAAFVAEPAPARSAAPPAPTRRT